MHEEVVFCLFVAVVAVDGVEAEEDDYVRCRRCHTLALFLDEDPRVQNLAIRREIQDRRSRCPLRRIRGVEGLLNRRHVIVNAL